jgi:hypothetical protein
MAGGGFFNPPQRFFFLSNSKGDRRLKKPFDKPPLS